MRSAYDYIPTAIQVIVLVIILSKLYRLSPVAKHRVEFVFYVFSVVSALLSDLYWLAFDILYPLDRMPFAANEVAECAIFLSYAYSIKAVTMKMQSSLPEGGSVREVSLPSKPETAGIFLFAAANTALWIGWSGEWLQDIITGVLFFYMHFQILRELKASGAMSSYAKAALAAVCIAIITLEAATFHVADPLKERLDLAAYILLLAAGLCLIISAYIFIFIKNDIRASIGLSFATYSWSLVFLYMSTGVFYNIANLMGAVAFFLMYLSIKREVLS